jgi:hypothetical protein
VTTPADVLPDTPSDRLPTRTAEDGTEPDLRAVHVIGITPPDDYDHWTPDALAGLIGQTPRVVIGGDWTRTVGTATVTAATARHDGAVRIGLDLPAYAAEAAGLVNGSPTFRAGIGFTLRKATIRDNGARRDLRDVGLRTVWSEEHSR